MYSLIFLSSLSPSSLILHTHYISCVSMVCESVCVYLCMVCIFMFVCVYACLCVSGMCACVCDVYVCVYMVCVFVICVCAFIISLPLVTESKFFCLCMSVDDAFHCVSYLIVYRISFSYSAFFLNNYFSFHKYLSLFWLSTLITFLCRFWPYLTHLLSLIFCMESFLKILRKCLSDISTVSLSLPSSNELWAYGVLIMGYVIFLCIPLFYCVVCWHLGILQLLFSLFTSTLHCFIACDSFLWLVFICFYVLSWYLLGIQME